jgi:hypothetical protein
MKFASNVLVMIFIVLRGPKHEKKIMNNHDVTLYPTMVSLIDQWQTNIVSILIEFIPVIL